MKTIALRHAIVLASALPGPARPGPARPGPAHARTSGRAFRLRDVLGQEDDFVSLRQRRFAWFRARAHQQRRQHGSPHGQARGL